MNHIIADEVYHINALGQAFYNKTIKDVRKSMFVAGPLFILFFTFCFLLIIGWTIYTFYLLILPLVLAMFLFYISPLVLRGRFINNLITTLYIETDFIEVETFRWFLYQSKPIRISEFSLDLNEQNSVTSISPDNCRINFRSNGKTQHLNMVRAFFDDWEKAISQLKALSK